MVSVHRIWRAAVAVTITLAGTATLPALARAQTLPAAAPSAFNETPDCPVSPTRPVCAWNVPVDAANLFTATDYGQCPYWAVEKYPALFLDALASDPLASDWDGGTWAEHAKLEGLPISRTPASGDLAVWGGTSSDSAGHVAYVEAVTGSGIIVSQMDGDSQPPFPPRQGSTEWISNANLAYFAQTFDVQFIVTGDPSTTPLAFLEKPAAAVSAPPVTESATPADTAPSEVANPPGNTSRAAASAARLRARARAARAHRQQTARVRPRRGCGRERGPLGPTASRPLGCGRGGLGRGGLGRAVTARTGRSIMGLHRRCCEGCGGRWSTRDLR
ncbi:CHAP domain-containing protein [Conexibacter sp. DBS9H8]|uniref:CHAP domain-containing protein n=1 Tax=Conexibacter sp. DBS9H8 TaxID=2937801 RepID=UPI00200EE8DB|nr:CHAP domain-containing protein [Conexibacter sp. DBS9H8]